MYDVFPILLEQIPPRHLSAQHGQEGNTLKTEVEGCTKPQAGEGVRLQGQTDPYFYVGRGPI